MNRAARAAVVAFEVELEQLVAARARAILKHVVGRLMAPLGLPPLERLVRRQEIARMRRARPRSTKADDAFTTLAREIVREPEPARALARAIDVDAFLEERGASGANEILEEALEKIRTPPEPAPCFAAGSVVVVKRDDTHENLARILEELPTGMVRVRRVNQQGRPIGKRTWLMVRGEVLRLADERRTALGKVRYELYPVTDAGAGVEPDVVVLPPGLRNIA